MLLCVQRTSNKKGISLPDQNRDDAAFQQLILSACPHIIGKGENKNVMKRFEYTVYITRILIVSAVVCMLGGIFTVKGLCGVLSGIEKRREDT